MFSKKEAREAVIKAREDRGDLLKSNCETDFSPIYRQIKDIAVNGGGWTEFYTIYQNGKHLITLPQRGFRSDLLFYMEDVEKSLKQFGYKIKIIGLADQKSALQVFWYE